MGTRSLTHFQDKDVVLCTLYRQMDGYPDGHGNELAEILRNFHITNGIRGDDERTKPKLANGMGCLSAQVITLLKGDTSHCQRMYEMQLAMHERSVAEGSALVYPKPKKPVERKCRVGSFYMAVPGTKDVWEDYTYTVYLEQPDPKVEIFRAKMRCETEFQKRGTGEKHTVVGFDGYPEDWDAEQVSQTFEEEYEKLTPSPQAVDEDLDEE